MKNGGRMTSKVLLLAAAGLAAGLAAASFVARAHEGHDHGTQKTSVQRAEVQQAPQMLSSTAYARSLRVYVLPEVTLLNAEARVLRLADVLAANAPVALQFRSSACSGGCSSTAEALSRLPATLGKDGARLRLLSITVDPEKDDPASLKAYAARQGAGKSWQFLTGAAQDLEALRRVFDDGSGKALGEAPIAFLRTAPGMPWVRVEGFATAEDLARELREAGLK
jgi:protein SCO1/2